MPATRRSLLIAAAVLAPARAQAFFWDSEPEPKSQAPVDPASDRDARFTGRIPDEPFHVPTVDLRLVPAEYRRQLVDYDGPERAGILVVDTHDRFLYLVREGRTAIRYGIGVGRAGFTWSGTAVIKRKAKWPGCDLAP